MVDSTQMCPPLNKDPTDIEGIVSSLEEHTLVRKKTDVFSYSILCNTRAVIGW